MRQKATSQEKLMWEKLRNNKLGNRFKRQYSIGGYILDFYCAEKRLVIELDGEIHNKKENLEYDKIRDKFFKELDYKVLRFKNRQVEEDIKGVIKIIGDSLE